MKHTVTHPALVVARPARQLGQGAVDCPRDRDRHRRPTPVSPATPTGVVRRTTPATTSSTCTTSGSSWRRAPTWRRAHSTPSLRPSNTARGSKPAEERLVVPTQVRASTDPAGDPRPGRVTGADFTDGGPNVNGYHAFAGACSTRPTPVQPRVHARPPLRPVLRASRHRHDSISAAERPSSTSARPPRRSTSPSHRKARSSCPRRVSPVSLTTLETAQSAAGVGTSVNELVLTLDDAADRGVVVAELEGALTAANVGAEVSTRDDNNAYRTLTNDVENDQQMFNVLAFLLFSGAVVAAYIMIHRLAQQQRREIRHRDGPRCTRASDRDAPAIGQRPDRTARRRPSASCVGMLIGNLMRGLARVLPPAADLGHVVPDRAVRRCRRRSGSSSRSSPRSSRSARRSG